MRILVSVFCFCLVVGLCVLADNPAPAQGKPSPSNKGLNKAFQVVPAQAQAKLVVAAQKGQHKGQAQQQVGQTKGKGKGKN